MIHSPNTSSQVDIFNSPLWGPVWAVIGFILSKIYNKIFGARRELSYVLISNTSLVNVKKDYVKDVNITYLKVPAKTLQLISVRLINTGNVTIKESDYDMPISFVDNKPERAKKTTGFFKLIFPDNSSISKRARATYRERVGIEKLMINPGESLTIEILNIDILDNNAEVDLQGRLIGGKIKEVKQPIHMRSSLVTTIFIPFVTGIVFTVITTFLNPKVEITVKIWNAAFLIFFLILFIITANLVKKKYYTKYN